MERRIWRLGLATVAAQLVLTAPSPAATPGTLGGRFSDGKLPPPAVGRAYVRAVRVPDGTVVGGTVAGPTGSWTLGLDPGKYVVLASVVRDDGKPVVSALTPIQAVRSGKTTKTTVSLKRKKTPRPTKKRRKRRAAHSAAVTLVPVALKNFSGSGPNSQLGHGLTDMLITELSNMNTGDCRPQVIEWERRQDILNEIALSNSKFADPRTRLRTDQLIDPAVFVQGSVETTETSATWNLQLVDAKTGDVLGGDTGTADGLAIFDAPAQIAQRLADQLCAGDYDVQVVITGSVTASSFFGTGIVQADVVANAVPGTSPPASWSGQGPIAFSSVTYGGIPECIVDPGANFGTVKVEIKPASTPGQIEVIWGGESTSTPSLICNGIPVPGGALPIMPFQMTMPTIFTLPASGGSVPLYGTLAGGGGGWTNTGTIVVGPLPK
jgi:hypothetical protein